MKVLSHQTKKPGCGSEIMEYFRSHPETGVSSPSQVAIVGDRLFTDMMLANSMGSYGLWIKDGVVPLQKKSIVRSSLALISLYTDADYYRSSRGWSRDLVRICSPGATSLRTLAAHSSSVG